MLEKYKKTLELIMNSKTICIVTHKSPDGDAIGGSMALYLTLKSMNKDVHVIIPKYSDRFSFLEELKYSENKMSEDAFDLLIAVDASNVERLALEEDDIKKASKVVVIDHHQNTTIDADVSIIDSNSPAACQLVYEFLSFSNINITMDVAKYLYMGIITDTGNFSYRNTTSKTLKIAANLIDTGIDFVYICKKINDTMKESRLKLIAYVIDNMETFLEGKIRYAKISKDILNKYNVPDEDAEGVVNYLRCVEGTCVAIYARELNDGSYKISLRSNGEYNVEKIAAKYNGGGHINAAGFNIDSDIDEIKDELIKVVGVELVSESNGNIKYK